MRKRKKHLVGILIILAGTLLFYYPDYREWQNHRSIDASIQEMEQKQEKILVPDDQETEQREYLDMEPVKQEEKKHWELHEELVKYNERLITEGQNITDAWSFRQMPVDLKSLNEGSDEIGYLRIPKIALSMPLYLGATEGNMAKGAVVLSETSMPVGGENTNCVIAGHRGWSGSPYFRDIDKLEKGSLVHIITPWEELVYQVTGSEVVHETDCSILNIRPGKDMVTLFSCYPYMSIGTSYRLAIYCERTENKEEAVTEKAWTSPLVKVSAMLEQDIVEKGIEIQEDPYQMIYDNEDLIRRMIPVAMLLFFLFIKTFCFLISIGSGRN